MRTYIPHWESISKERYKELLAFCRQYDEARQKLGGCYSLASPALTGMPKTKSKVSSTERKAELAIRYRQHVELIESCARAACGNNAELTRAMIENVCRGVRYEYTAAPVSRVTFLRARRRFFEILDERK